MEKLLGAFQARLKNMRFSSGNLEPRFWAKNETTTHRPAVAIVKNHKNLKRAWFDEWLINSANMAWFFPEVSDVS